LHKTSRLLQSHCCCVAAPYRTSDISCESMSHAPRGNAPPFWVQACLTLGLSDNVAHTLQSMDVSQYTVSALLDFKQHCPTVHPLPACSLLPLCPNPLPQHDRRLSWLTANTLWCLTSHVLAVLLTHLPSRRHPLYLHAKALHHVLDQACAVLLLLHTQGHMSIVASPFETQVTWHVARMCRSLLHMKLMSSKS